MLTGNLMADSSYSLDPFSDRVYQSLPFSIRKSLSREQQIAIKTALKNHAPDQQQHPLNIKGRIPLFYIKLYYVLLIGRDKRSKTRYKEQVRRRKLMFASTIFGFYCLVCTLMPIAFLGLYVIKRLVGFDFFPGFHLKDLLVF